MKRPLLAVCAWVVCLIALWQALFPPELKNHDVAGQKVYVYGQVAAKQYRISNGRESSILFLSNVTICSVEAIVRESKASMEVFNYPTSWDIISKQSLENLIEKSNWDNGRLGTQVMVHLDGEEPAMGSYVLVEGILSDFDLPTNPGEFNSRLYYASMGIGMRMYDGTLCWVSQSHSFVREYMWRCKCSWSAILEERLGKEQGSVLSTILFGSKDRLDTSMKGLYQQSGISHILAISGLHMSLVGMSFYKLLRRLGIPLWASAILGICIIVTYGVFTDAGASAFRAAGMFVIRMLGILLERSYDTMTSLGVLLCLMVVQNPLYLYQSGFLLSFGAMIGIGCILPLLEGDGKGDRYREGMAKFLFGVLKGVKQALLVSFSVTVTTLPIMALAFYEIAPYSMVLNLIVIPLLPTLFVLGITLIVVSPWSVSTIICALTKLVLNLYSSLAKLSLTLPGSRCIVGGVSTFQVLFYVLVLGTLILWGKRITRQGCFKLILIGIFTMTVPVNFGTEICFLDVGQGDGVFLRSSTGKVYMVDGGSSSESDVGKYTIAPFLKSKGVREIEGWIITHPDADHCNGLESVLEAGYGDRVKRILLPDVKKEVKEEAYIEIEALAESYKIPVYYLSEGMNWAEESLSPWAGKMFWDENLWQERLTFLCLHPPVGYGQADSANEYSLVLYVTVNEYSVLLTGDVEGRGERLLVEQLKMRGISHVDVLKVAHHGSRYSTLEGFLDVIDADVAVISCGEDNWYGHPHKETLERLYADGSIVLTTPECGAVQMKVGKELRIRRWKEQW
ncbi:MAG: DNA internalization-related competence protein ComEC/Rec2 [Lachnospiraceae bacterium]|nr:DNA internalization-related competence protein ComEC/Rec2 [Lachnospiraceae bacterium]